MKQITGFLLIVVGLFAGVLRWLDLVNYTDYETGYPIAGSVWWRYAVMALLVVIAFSASFMAARRPCKLEEKSPKISLFAFLLAALFAVESTMRLLANFTMETFFAKELVFVVLGFATAIWLALCGLSYQRAPYRVTVGGTLVGICGSLYFYYLLVIRFAENSSSFYHIAPTVGVFAAAAALAFTTVLVRAVLFGDTKTGRKLYAMGMSTFYLCTCFAFPQALCTWILGQMTLAVFAQHVLLAGVGLFGAVCAQKTLCAEKAATDSVKKAKKVKQVVTPA